MPSVLVVDDEKNVLKTLSIGLKRHHFTVKEANNGNDALHVLEETPCDMMISDIRMSPMDGYTLAEEVNKRFPQVQVVLMSAYSFENENPEMKARIQCPRLTKPFPITRLLDILDESSRKIKIKSAPRILVFMDENKKEIEALKSNLNQFNVTLTSQIKSDSLLTQFSWDLFIVDCDVLNSGDWTILNTLERLAPNCPVILLSCEKEGSNELMQESELHFTVMNKSQLLEEKSRAEEMIRQVLRS